MRIAQCAYGEHIFTAILFIFYKTQCAHGKLFMQNSKIQTSSIPSTTVRQKMPTKTSNTRLLVEFHLMTH